MTGSRFVLRRRPAVIGCKLASASFKHLGAKADFVTAITRWKPALSLPQPGRSFLTSSPAVKPRTLTVHKCGQKIGYANERSLWPTISLSKKGILQVYPHMCKLNV